MENKNVLSKQLFDQNEKRSVYFLAILSIVFSFLELFTLLLDLTGSIINYKDIDKYLMVITAFANIIVGLLPFVFPKSIRITKYVLILAVLINVGVLDITFSYYSLGFFLVPMLVSTRFYNRKLTISVIIASLLVLVADSFILWSVARTGAKPFVRYFVDIDYADLSQVLGQVGFFKILCLLVPSAVCLVISLNGRSMIAKQAEVSTNVGSLENEIKTASSIQDQVLPKDFCLVEDNAISMFANMTPAKEVAGDFYDFFVVKNKLYFLIGDVSDKGLYAAMFMMNIKNIIHSIALSNDNVEDIITMANKLICKDNDNLMFVTLWIASIDLDTKKGYFVNAGHSDAYIKKADGSLVTLNNEPQTFVGAFPNYVYKKEPFSLEKGDLIYLYTDGVTDALNVNNEAFGSERLEKCLNEPLNTPKEVCEHVINEINEYSKGKEQFDDTTMLALKINEYMYENELKCEPESIEEVQSNITKDLQAASIEQDTINLVNTALDDLLDNIVSYAYVDKNNTFKCMYQIKDRNLKIVVSDKGVSFNPLKVKPADLSADRPIGGLGIHLIKNIMDTVEYSGERNQNLLVLTKKL